MFVVALILTVIMLLLTYSAARSSTGGYYAVIPTALGVALLPLCLMTISTFLFILAGAVIAVALVCHLLHARPRTFLAGSTLAVLAVYFATYFYLTSDLSETGRALRKYPVESMAARLSHESLPERKQRGGTWEKEAYTQMADTLNLLEERIGRESPIVRGETQERSTTLWWLHQDTLEHFIQQPGFGVGRGVPVPKLRALDVLGDSAEPIKQPEADYIPGKDQPDSTNWSTMDVTSSFGVLHVDSLTDFLNPIRFGYFMDRNRVAGFIPHRFRRVPASVPYSNKTEWKIVRVELVSILKYEKPAVYVSPNLPRMEELREASTRPLDEFELAALAQIKKGQDRIVAQKSDLLRMVGSIRAIEQCAKCHLAEHGDLLGAFSFTLRKEPRR